MTELRGAPDRFADVVIRSYRPEDADALWAILLSAFDAGELTGSTRTDIEHWHSRLPADPGGTLVAVHDDQVAGLITPRRNQMIIGQSFRRRGIGTKLVEAGEALNRERGDGPLYLALPHENEGALAFYEALGFRYHHSLWSMRLRDNAVVPPPAFPASVVRHPYRDDDVVAFVDLVNTVFLDHPTSLSVTADHVRFVHSLPEFAPDNLCLLSPADAPDLLIGFCRVNTERDEGRTIGDVAVLGVRREWRRHGLGRELLRWGVQRARELGAVEVVLAVEGENERALRLYERTGFEWVEEWPRYSRPGS